MSRIWHYDANLDKWSSRGLDGPCVLVPAVHTAAVRLVPAAGPSGDSSWTLLAGNGLAVRINGVPLVLGLRLLRDRDEIATTEGRWYYTSEELAEITPYPGLGPAACCPRCKQSLLPEVLSVKCPRCHAWHHQSEQYPCWTYDTTCAFCQVQQTDLDAGYAWTPEQL